MQAWRLALNQRKSARLIFTENAPYYNVILNHFNCLWSRERHTAGIGNAKKPKIDKKIIVFGYHAPRR